MKHQEWLLDFQTKREDADGKWQIEQADKAAKAAEVARGFQKTQAESQRRHERRALLVALCGVAVAMYAALKKNDPQPAPIVQPTFQPSFQVVIPAKPTEKPAVRQIEQAPAKLPA